MLNEPFFVDVKLNDNYQEWLDMLFGNNADLRKDWMLEGITPAEVKSAQNNKQNIFEGL